jgi:hypothetical protein
MTEERDILKEAATYFASESKRGPHCVLAFDAVAKLREKGMKARRMEDGYPEWKTSGLPVEGGTQ